MHIKIIVFCFLSITMLASTAPVSKKNNGETIKRILPVRELQKTILEYLSDDWVEDHKFTAKNPITSVRFSHDSDTLVYTDQNDAQLWKLTPHKKLIQTISLASLFQRIFGTADSEISSPVAFSPDGKYLATKHGNNTIIFWQKEKDQYTLKQTVETRETVTALAFSTDNTYLAAGQEYGLVSLFKKLNDHTFKLDYSLFFKSIYFPEETDEFFIARKLLNNDPSIKTLIFSTNGLVTSDGNTIKIFKKMFSEKLNRNVYIRQGELATDDSKTIVAVSPNGKLAISQSNGLIYLFDRDNENPQSMILQKKLNKKVPGTTPFAFAPDTNIVAFGSADNTIKFWDIKLMKPRSQLIVPQPAHALAFSPDGNYFAAAYGNSVQLWKSKGKVLAQDLGFKELEEKSKKQAKKLTEID